MPTLLLFISSLSILSSLYMWGANRSLIISWCIILANSIALDFPIAIDPFSLIFLSVVCLISYSVFLFARWYMSDDSMYARFYYLLILFVLSIAIFILIPHLLAMFIGWDGLGLSSFLLILHYQRPRRLEAGLMTIIINRAGDAFLLITICLWASNGGWFFVDLIYFHINSHMDIIAFFFLILAALTKRAQVPFNIWLPAAIEAPTPVSSLVHSSTLVTAGVYLLIRTYNVWRNTIYISFLVFIAGLLSIFLGGSFARIEADVKKTIAYSTLRQVGFMIIALGLGFPIIAYFHLLTHALFKATLFISAGCIFKYNHHYQTYDCNYSKWHTPLIGLGITSSLLSINVFPFLGGIYSKELLINRSLVYFNEYHLITLSSIVMYIFLFGSLFTSLYSMRIWKGLWRQAYLKRPESIITPRYRYNLKREGETTLIIVPLLRMIAGTVTLGACLSWVLVMPAEIPIINLKVKILTLRCILGGLTLGAAMGENKYRRFYTSPINSGIIFNKSIQKKIIQVNAYPWFPRRQVYPVYRLLHLCGKYVIILERGMLYLWPQSLLKLLTYVASILSNFRTKWHLLGDFLIGGILVFGYLSYYI